MVSNLSFLSVSPELSSKLVSQTADESAEAFEPFQVTDIPTVLGISSQEFTQETERAEKAPEEEILALISAKLLEQKVLDPNALARTIAESTLVPWLDHLEVAKQKQ